MMESFSVASTMSLSQDNITRSAMIIGDLQEFISSAGSSDSDKLPLSRLSGTLEGLTEAYKATESALQAARVIVTNVQEALVGTTKDCATALSTIGKQVQRLGRGLNADSELDGVVLADYQTFSEVQVSLLAAFKEILEMWVQDFTERTAEASKITD